MTMQLNTHELDEDILLKNFTQDDFEMAKSNLLDRYQIWLGLLISNDARSVITPDDLEYFRTQTTDLIAQELKSDYEWEQLKILTVLTYLLMDADKTVLPNSNHPLQDQLDQNELFHANRYITRKIIYASEQLSLAEIERLVTYENQVLKSYQDQTSQKNDRAISTIKGLKCKEDQYFNLHTHSHKINIETTKASQAHEALVPFRKAVSKPTASGTTTTSPVVIADDQADLLIDTVQAVTLKCLATAHIASYVGKGRENNEDCVIVHPEHDQLIVVDAMGGYGNGVIARDVFVESALEFPGDIDQTVTHSQKQYDVTHVDQGGVCIIGAKIGWQNDSYTIELAQAGDVHAILYDKEGNIRHETHDEAIGHQVINAVISYRATITQRANGWQNFGSLTRITLRARPEWRLAIYSDGISNHFHAMALTDMIIGKSAEAAIDCVSAELDVAMSQDRSYRDNSSIALIDFPAA